MLFQQSSNAAAFVKPQWIMTPLASNRQLLVLSGAVIVNFASGAKSGWTSELVQILPDQDMQDAVALAQLGAPPTNQSWGFRADQYATFGGLTSVFDKNEADNAGFAVDSFIPNFTPAVQSNRIVSGVQLNLAVQDRDASILRVGYQLTAVGQFMPFSAPPIQ